VNASLTLKPVFGLISMYFMPIRYASRYALKRSINRWSTLSFLHPTSILGQFSGAH
jgi:hypothetical protein